jgi:RNA polymerase sigma-70 factor (ECF subfamily)
MKLHARHAEVVKVTAAARNNHSTTKECKMDASERRFQQIYDEYQERIFRYLVRMVGECDAEDLTQEVFVKVSLALDTFRGESKLSTWIYQIATNAALDKIRSSRRGDSVSLPFTVITEEQSDKDFWTDEREDSSELKVIRQEMNDCIREIIDGLPESYRSVIVLSELEGLKDNEIAEVIGLSLQATKIRLHRARTRLRKALQRNCVFYRNEHNELACDRKK